MVSIFTAPRDATKQAAFLFDSFAKLGGFIRIGEQVGWVYFSQ